jgi:serine/threonine protein kinase
MTKREGDSSSQETLPAPLSQKLGPSALAPGDVVLGKYEIVRAIGVGGMGQVFRAIHRRLNRDVAVKILPENGSEEHALRFQREAALMTRVRHPNVVEILDFGFVNGKAPCIVMELVDGESLSARRERKRVLPWAEAAKIILGVLDGLEAVHDAAILHRDLKPSNVAMAKGPPEIAKLLDFGIARSVHPGEGDRRVTRTGNIVGSLDYMSPEALVNEPLDQRTDVYAAAMMLYEMLTGGFPFRDDAMAAAFRRLSTDPPPPAAPAGHEAIPQPLAELVARGLSRDRERRPATADAFARELRELLRPKKLADAAKPSAPAITPAKPVEPVVAPKPVEPVPAPKPVAAPKPIEPVKRVIANAGLGAPPKPPKIEEVRAPAGVVHPSTPRSEPTTGSTAAVGRVARPQFVVIARLPNGKLGQLEERRWLAELVRDAGKAYALGSDLWCAVLVALEPAAAEKHSLVLLDALEARYPHVRVVGGTIFDPRFELKNNPQGSALPEPLPSLLAQLAAMGH